ncbi:MAG: VgrG-related protein [Actinomycetota bacterium]
MPANEYTTAFTIKVGGQELKPEALEKIREWRVDDHLKLPDTFAITVFEPNPDRMSLIDDAGLFAVGAEVEIAASAVPVDSRPASPVTLIKGIVTSIEPEFTAEAGAIMTIRGYDRSHTLHQEKRATTFQNMTVGDIVNKVVGGTGLTPQVGSLPGGPLDFVQQNNESDWEFLGRIAQRVGARVAVSGTTLEFKPVGDAKAGPQLEWGKNLLSFKPRVTGVQQAKEVVVRGWDATSKRTIEATARPGALMARIGEARDRVVSAANGGRFTIADRPVRSADEAQALADSAMGKIANSFLEAEGVCLGDPAVKAGGQVEVKGVGRRFGGTYTLSATRHVYRANGYRTHFTISGEADRSLVDLLTPARTKRWGNSVVLGLVTNNQDPAGLGRVRVKYPALGDTEGYWARVCTIGAGPKKGVLMTPQVDDEVVIAFEHDDINHPYVLGTVWNGQDKPEDLVQEDGSFALKSEKKMLVTVKEEIAFTGDKELTFTVGESKVVCKKDGTIEITGKTLKLTGQQSVTIEASQGSLTLKGTQGVSVSSTGQVSVSGAQVSLG